MAMQDAVPQFGSEEAPGGFVPALTDTTNHAIDAASRAVAFMLGFALASVLAGILTLAADDPLGDGGAAAATKVESVAPAVEPVVTGATPADAVGTAARESGRP